MIHLSVTFRTVVAICGLMITALTMSAQVSPTRIEAIPAPNNFARIEAINNASVIGKKEPKDKIHGGYVYTFWGVAPNSILEDENIFLSFEETLIPVYADISFGHGYFPSIHNKSDKSVFVDLANSFFVDSKGVSYPFFTNSTYTTSKSSSTGVGINLGAVAGAFGIGGALGNLAGGISVGGSSGGGTSVTQQQQQIAVIPPHSASRFPLMKFARKQSMVDMPFMLVYMEDRPYHTWSGDGKFENNYREWYGNYADFSESTISADEIGLRENSFVRFNRENSPKVIKIIFTYSTDPNFAEYYTVETELYLKNLFGAGKYLDFRYEPKKKLIPKHFVPKDEDAPLLWGYGWIPKTTENKKTEAKGASMDD